MMGGYTIVLQCPLSPVGMSLVLTEWKVDA